VKKIYNKPGLFKTQSQLSSKLHAESQFLTSSEEGKPAVKVLSLRLSGSVTEMCESHSYERQ